MSSMLSMAMFLLISCVPCEGSSNLDDPTGFVSGVWHGWIAPFSLIYSLFNSRIGIYEVYNTGFWYNLGYYMAIVSGFGGLSLARRKGRREDRD